MGKRREEIKDLILANESILKEIIYNILNKNDSVIINDKTTLIDDLGFDSIQLVSLIVEIECTFGIELDDEDLEIRKITKYGSLKQLIENKINEHQL